MTPLFRNARYVAWLVSDTSRGLAEALFAFAIPLIALVVTDDPAQAGVIAATGAAVRLVLTLAGGVLADRRPRIPLMIAGAVIGCALAGAFALLATADALTFAVLLAIDALLAARTGLFDVAGESALKQVVAPEEMGRAQAANQARDAALQLAGGPLGGLLLTAGAGAVGAAMAACHAIAGAAAWAIDRLRPAPGAPAAARRPRAAAGAGPRSAGREVIEGLAWIWARPDLRGVVVVTTIVNLGISAAVTTAIYALQQAGHSPAAIGWVGAGVGAAMLVGALGAGPVVHRVPTGLVAISGLAALACGAAGVALVTTPWAVTAVLAAPALLLPAVNAGLSGYFVVATPDRLLGRANAAAQVFSRGAMPLAPLVAGLGLAWAGRGPTILVCAGICALAAALAVGTRALRILPAEPAWAEHARGADPIPAA
ncbi:MFS transporter [Microbacterium excoecariae]|uniref:MFS transporter n=1 Tax=Microbacterium excoecariae TaxID=2715210 RepID=UPI00140D9C57|nr:MFS transporter [Microbacterium excoecariae]NHI16163.1 MFS transporter [Microbacterium excoecariae]